MCRWTWGRVQVGRSLPSVHATGEEGMGCLPRRQSSTANKTGRKGERGRAGVIAEWSVERGQAR